MVKSGYRKGGQDESQKIFPHFKEKKKELKYQ
jgi:hypothetical protein